MFREHLKGVAVALPLVTAVLTVVAPPVLAGEHLRSEVHQSLWYYWPNRFVYYNIQTTGSSGLNVGPGALLDGESIRDAAGRSFSAWASQPCTDMQFYFAGFTADRGSNMTSEDINGKNSIIFRYEDWDGTECQDAIACTTVVTRRAAGEILDADIDLNGADHEFVLDPIPGSMAFDLQSVLTHEVGHMIGFNHTQIESAVMWPYASWGDAATRRELAQDDVEILCETYTAGECTMVNDWDQRVCPETVLDGGCGAAPVPRSGRVGGIGLLALVFGAALLARFRCR
ncbi:MAG: matrixin family metalloprotease [Deltaproteobacteria bacterium]|nr:matrixin family metalloprotease [Deltaproteobacteria bacterium]